jgi:hypothetical protein
MPNLTLCLNPQCPMSETCYRHEAKPSQHQSMALFNYRLTENGIECDEYIPIREVRDDDD